MTKATAAASHYKTNFTPLLPNYLIKVTNTGNVTSDVSVLGFVTATASVKGHATDAPLKSLFDFERLSHGSRRASRESCNSASCPQPSRSRTSEARRA